MYVTEDANTRVQVFTPDGTYIIHWGATGDALNQLIGIAVRPVGHVLVVDYGNSWVVVYAPDGTFLTAFGSGGDGSG